MQKLLISAIVVTKNNGELIKYSIESIVNYIDEILIYDDSDCNDKNLYLCDLEKYNNVKIINHNHDYGTDLGKKKNT